MRSLFARLAVLQIAMGASFAGIALALHQGPDALGNGGPATVLAAASLATTALTAFGWWRLRRRWQRERDAAIAHIGSITEGRWVERREPASPEWADVTRALNVMVARLRDLANAQEAAMSRLHGEVSVDALTRLPSRLAFMDQLQRQLADPTRAPGALLLVRVVDLASLNQREGREHGDELLRGVAAVLRMRAAGLRDARCLAARLNGADFGLLVDGASPSVVTSLVKALHASLMTLHGQSLSPARAPALVGAALLMPGVTAAEALGCADAMLRECELEGTGWRISTPGRVSLRRTAGQWRRLLDEALSSGRVRLVRHGVDGADGVPPHEDTDLEVLDDDGRPVDRAAWQAAALRTQRIDDFDLRNVELALEHLGQQPTPLAVALHVASCVRPSFVRRLGMVLDAAAARRDRLWLELDLGASARAADDVAAVLAELRLRGLRVGVRHAPADPAALDRLAKAGVTHVRMARDVGDASAGAAAEHHRSLERMVGAAGLQVLTPRGADALA